MENRRYLLLVLLIHNDAYLVTGRGFFSHSLEFVSTDTSMAAVPQIATAASMAAVPKSLPADQRMATLPASTGASIAQAFWNSRLEDGVGKAVEEDKILFMPTPDPSSYCVNTELVFQVETEKLVSVRRNLVHLQLPPTSALIISSSSLARLQMSYVAFQHVVRRSDVYLLLHLKIVVPKLTVQASPLIEFPSSLGEAAYFLGDCASLCHESDLFIPQDPSSAGLNAATALGPLPSALYRAYVSTPEANVLAGLVNGTLGNFPTRFKDVAINNNYELAPDDSGDLELSSPATAASSIFLRWHESITRELRATATITSAGTYEFNWPVLVPMSSIFPSWAHRGPVQVLPPQIVLNLDQFNALRFHEPGTKIIKRLSQTVYSGFDSSGNLQPVGYCISRLATIMAGKLGYNGFSALNTSAAPWVVSKTMEDRALSYLKLMHTNPPRIEFRLKTDLDTGTTLDGAPLVNQLIYYNTQYNGCEAEIEAGLATASTDGQDFDARIFHIGTEDLGSDQRVFTLDLAVTRGDQLLIGLMPTAQWQSLARSDFRRRAFLEKIPYASTSNSYYDFIVDYPSVSSNLVRDLTYLQVPGLYARSSNWTSASKPANGRLLDLYDGANVAFGLSNTRAISYSDVASDRVPLKRLAISLNAGVNCLGMSKDITYDVDIFKCNLTDRGAADPAGIPLSTLRMLQSYSIFKPYLEEGYDGDRVDAQVPTSLLNVTAACPMGKQLYANNDFERVLRDTVLNGTWPYAFIPPRFPFRLITNGVGYETSTPIAPHARTKLSLPVTVEFFNRPPTRDWSSAGHEYGLNSASSVPVTTESWTLYAIAISSSVVTSNGVNIAIPPFNNPTTGTSLLVF